MMSGQTHGAYYAKPKFSLWRALGFGTCAAPRPGELAEHPDWAPSWFIITTRARLDWRDRLRVLVSGNLCIDQAVKTDVPIARSRSTSAISVEPPSSHRRWQEQKP
jgi:hypothetical protein